DTAKGLMPELVPEEIARKSHYKLDQAAPIAKVEDPRRIRPDHRPCGAHGLTVCHRKWRTSSIRPVAFWDAEHWMAKSAGPCRRATRNVAVRSLGSSRLSPTSCTLAWWLWISITAIPDS